MAKRSRRGKTIHPWWSFDEKHTKEAGKAAMLTAREIARKLHPRRREMLQHMRIYAGRYDLRGGSYAADQQPSYNITRSIVDTARSLIAAAKPRPMFTTSDGGWELKQRAKLRARIIDGQFDIANIDALRHQWFEDGAVCGIGILVPYIDPASHEVRASLADPLRYLVDPREGLRGQEARSTYYLSCVDRGVLLADFEDDPEACALINQADAPEQSGFDLDMLLDADTTADQVLVLESVHLPSRAAYGDQEASEDGKRMISVSGGALTVDPYTEDIQPHAYFRYQDDPCSFYGKALAEQCRAASRRLNRLGEQTEAASRLGSTLKWLLPRGAEVDERELSNEMGTGLEFDERHGRPELVPMAAVHPSWFQERDSIREEVFSATGYSTLQAEGNKPPGLNSGAAQIAHDDIQSRRHAPHAQQWEIGHMRLTRVFEILNDRNTEDGHDIPLPAKYRRGRSEFVREVRWSEVTKDAGKLYTRTFPISSLPNTPRGKWGLVKDWIGTGFMSRLSAQQLMDFPDIDEQLRFEFADYDAVMNDIEDIIDGNFEVMPVPMIDPAVAIDISRASYLQLRTDRAPDDILETVQRYMTSAQALVTMAQQPQGAPQGVPQQVPPGVPGAAQQIPQGPVAAQPGQGVVAA